MCLYAALSTVIVLRVRRKNGQDERQIINSLLMNRKGGGGLRSQKVHIPNFLCSSSSSGTACYCSFLRAIWEVFIFKRLQEERGKRQGDFLTVQRY